VNLGWPFKIGRSLPIYRQGAYIGRHMAHQRSRYIGGLICSDSTAWVVGLAQRGNRITAWSHQRQDMAPNACYTDIGKNQAA